jgi:dipeptidyl aminopeptidase/acylaminoacyl peptidase
VSVTAPPRPPDQRDLVAREELEALVEALIEEARKRAQRRRRRNAAVVALVALVGALWLYSHLGTGRAGSDAVAESGTPRLSASRPNAALPEELSFNANGSVALVRRDGSRLPFLSGILQPPGERQRHLYSAIDWSPDGSKLLALRSGYGVRALEVTDETGKVVSTLDPNAFDGRWSPDGTRIAFVHVEPTPGRLHPEPGLDHALLVASSDGRLRIRIAAHVREFSWSPDGTKLAYAACARHCGPSRAQGAHRLVIADATGRRAPHPVPLPAGAGAPGRTFTDVHWSSDGSLIAFVAHDDLGTHLDVVRPDGSSLRRAADVGEPLVDFDWSPDGKRLALVVSAGPGSADVSVVNADGTDLNRIARCRCDLHGFRPDFYESVAWSFDGTRIAYVSGRGNTVSTIRPDGTGATVVARQAARGVAGGPSARTRGYWYPSFPLWRPTRTR